MPVWNGECSDYFTVANGVKQSGIVSAVLFCVYLDGLLLALSDAKVGCYIGKVYVGALAYGDDVTLLAPTPRAMHLQLQICEKYSSESSLMLLNLRAWLLVEKLSAYPPWPCSVGIMGCSFL